MEDQGVSDLKSSTLRSIDPPKPGFRGWIRVGTIAAASALVGGLAAAWYYRKTLNTLREAESQGGNPDFGIPDAETEADT